MKRFDSNRVISYQFYLFYWKGQIMNNHHKIISLYVVLTTKFWGFFLKKKLFTVIQKVAKLPNSFHGDIQSFKMTYLKNQKRFSHTF